MKVPDGYAARVAANRELLRAAWGSMIWEQLAVVAVGGLGYGAVHYIGFGVFDNAVYGLSVALGVRCLVRLYLLTR